MEQWPLSVTEFGERYGVHYTAVSRALAAAQRAQRADPARCPAPPQPVNPGAPRPRYLPEEMDPWWDARPRRGRPPANSPQEQPLSVTEFGERYGVHYTAVSRALAAAQRAHEADPVRCPAPPQPVTGPGRQRRLYLPSVMDPWWEARLRRAVRRPPLPLRRGSAGRA